MTAKLKQPKNLSPLLPLVVIVTANYLVQIPYYFHQYYAPHQLLPNLLGSMMLLATLLWFVAAYRMLYRGGKTGWWLMSGYLLVVFLFYVQTQIMQLAATHQILLYVYHPHNVLLFVVFGLGYINGVTAAVYLVYLVYRYKRLVMTPDRPRP